MIKDIDTNTGQLLKTDAKLYAIHVSPSEKELRAIGNTEQQQAEAMKRYIRKVFIPEYAKNFNKGLSEADIKFYGKIHFDRNRYDNKLNMHCHLIVSRKDQSNKKKLSPLTNHKNTKRGIIKGGFDRINLFQQAEQGFDKLFKYNRQQTESFNYYNTIKHSSIPNQFKLQKLEIQFDEKETEINIDNKEGSNQNLNIYPHILIKQKDNTSFNLFYNQKNEEKFDSFFSFISSKTTLSFGSEEQPPKSNKKKNRRKL